MNCSLIITTYNWPQALQLVLKSVSEQTIIPEEVIIADDGSSEETLHIINQFRENSALNLIHSWQDDNGFRVAKSRNKAIAKSNENYIILIDGDMVLHPKFVEDHINHAEQGYFVQGARVLLTQSKAQSALKEMKTDFSGLSSGLKNRKNAIHSNFLSKLFLQKKNYLRGIKTCNMAFFRKDCIAINGFNNGFEGWGREDSEFIVRLLNNGINRKNLRFNAIQFHLWHNENVRNSLIKNDMILQKAVNETTKWCEDGINQYLEN